MGIVNLQTDLKSLKFGKDRFAGGDSGQPYIRKSIEQDPSKKFLTTDFLWRGGMKAPLDAATDVVRLTKWFFNFKSPSGLLFLAKENLLSRVAVSTQASGNLLNQGAYTPLTTLTQAGIGFTGLHIPKQGLIPFKGVKTYEDVISPNIEADSIKEIENNRLTNLYEAIKGNYSVNNFNFQKGTSFNTPSGMLLTYKGGPGSILGIGKTNIRFSDQRTGEQNIKGKEIIAGTYQVGISNSGTDFTNLPLYNPTIGGGVSGIFLKNYPVKEHLSTVEIFGSNNYNEEGEKLFQTSVYTIGEDRSTIFINSDRIKDQGSSTWTQEMIEHHQIWDRLNPTQEDFRKPLLKDAEGKSTIMGLAPSYNPSDNWTIDNTSGKSRINYTDPGQIGNVIDYTQGKTKWNGKSWEPIGPIDRINALPIYKSGYVLSDPVKNDLVKFRIAAISNNNPSSKEFIHFRAYIDSFSDSYKGSWNSQKYMGRGEPFYKYNEFNRSISLSFTVAAQSKEEIMVMYRKLNFLASNLAPDYSSKGYMAGPLIQLTLGGWCYELPGFISALELEIPQESPWEIAIPNLDTEMESWGGIKRRDQTLKEMPMICKVSGLTFTPIHRFVPSKQKNIFGDRFGVNREKDYTGKNKQGEEKLIEKMQGIRSLKSWGRSRFIQLDDGGSNNAYDKARLPESDDLSSKLVKPENLRTNEQLKQYIKDRKEYEKV